MPVADSVEPGPDGACRACGKQLAPGALVCRACGAAHGEANRCPHCNAVADVEPHPALGFRCRVCGGPRIAIDTAGVVLSQATRGALLAAGRAQAKLLIFSAAGWLLAGMGALGFAVAAVVLLATSPGLWPTLATLLGCAVPLGAGIALFARAAGARRLRSAALHGARVSALGDVQAVTGALDAARASELLHLDPERAELLLAEASVASLLDDVPPPRLRVEAAAPTLADDAASGESLPRGLTARGDTES
jgi:hypothetical protein